MQNNPKQKHVFCVDDDPNILGLLEMVLENMDNIRVHKFTDAYAAIEAMRQYPPALVLLDIIMPELNGITGYHMIRSNHQLRNVPVIFVTAKNRDQDLKQYESMKVPVITKPIKINELEPFIRQFL